MNHWDAADVVAFLLPPLIAASGAGLIEVVHSHIAEFLIAWIMASFPIGVMFGHCAINERSGGFQRDGAARRIG